MQCELYEYSNAREEAPWVKSVCVGRGETAHLIAKFEACSADLEKLMRAKKSIPMVA